MNQQQQERSGTLLLLRNGQSMADAAQELTGLLDPPLTHVGVLEAVSAAALLQLAGVAPDLVVTSPLQRASETARTVVEHLGGEAPTVVSWRLAARDLGCMTGENKRRALQRFGERAYMAWRYAPDGLPPAADPAQVETWRWRPAPDVVRNLPFGAGESMQQTALRVTPVWEEDLRPALAGGGTVLVVAHADSLRALRTVIAGVAESGESGVVAGQPIVYRVGADGTVLGPARYLEDVVSSARPDGT